MRYLYSLLMYIFLPLIFLRLYWKSLKLPAYRERLGERRGYYPFRLDSCLWVHAVSMGEVIAAVPLIKELKQLYPDTPLLVTTMTPTGAQQVKQRFGNDVIHAYIPYDYPGAVSRFFKNMNPRIAIIIETELWPNLVAACKKRSIPICLLNARLSEKSARGYRRISWLVKPMLAKINAIAVHAKADADRFIALGAKKENVSISGSIKYDMNVPAGLVEKSALLREELGRDRFVWIAASTHEGEDEVILSAHEKLLTKNPRALLILVPRHPERFDKVETMCSKSFETLRRSDKDSLAAFGKKVKIYLGDTMGELLLLYGAADVAFVGGSLIKRGGHNLLEPAALSKPVLSGPHVFNFAEISEQLKAGGALVTVTDAVSLASSLAYLSQHPEKCAQYGAAAKKVVDANRGALMKQLAVVHSLLVG